MGFSQGGHSRTIRRSRATRVKFSRHKVEVVKVAQPFCLELQGVMCCMPQRTFPCKPCIPGDRGLLIRHLIGFDGPQVTRLPGLMPLVRVDLVDRLDCLTVLWRR